MAQGRRGAMTCVFLFESTLGERICVLGHIWPCETDSTVCGDYEEDTNEN